MAIGFGLLPVAALAIVAAPKNWAALVFVSAVVYVPTEVSFQFASLNMYPLRVFIVAGIARVITRPAGRCSLVGSDWWAMGFAATAMLSSMGHKDPRAAFIANAGLALDCCGIYFLCRRWFSDWGDIVRFVKCLPLVFIPMAVVMLGEIATGKNFYSYVSGGPLGATVRGERLRARGTFRSAILAGSIGATLVPLAVAGLRANKRLGVTALATALVLVFTSASSGPIVGLAAGIWAVALWRLQHRMKVLVRGGIAVLLFLHLVMQAPVWYLMARVDLVGGSTGWHRAKLIDAAIEHFGEWWAAGTDYTRNWMPTGIGWSPDHTDITNHFIRMGVAGGLLLMAMFVGLLACSYRHISFGLRCLAPDPGRRFVLWCLGASLFTHTIIMFSVSYFDQAANTTLYSLFAVIASASMVLSRDPGFSPCSQTWVPESDGPGQGSAAAARFSL